jgi:DhnA family fructose-bisphosphate aldolase class Ia
MFSGGEKKPVEEETLDKARTCMDAGAIGMIIGRNAWGRETLSDAKDMAGKLYKILADINRQVRLLKEDLSTEPRVFYTHS